MVYKYSSIDNRRKAKRHLEKLMVELADIEKSDSMSFQPRSALGQSSAYYMKIENVEGVHIYNDGPGRWYADVVLKNVPDGISQVMGVPTKSPVPTQQEAWDFARNLLLMMRDAENTHEPPDAVVFILDGLSISIPMEAYRGIAELRKLMPDFGPGYIDDLMRRTLDVFGGKLTEEAVAKASREELSQLMMAATFGSMSGLNRWPELKFDETTDKASSMADIDPADWGIDPEDMDAPKP